MGTTTIITSARRWRLRQNGAAHCETRCVPPLERNPKRQVRARLAPRTGCGLPATTGILLYDAEAKVGYAWDGDHVNGFQIYGRRAELVEQVDAAT